MKRLIKEEVTNCNLYPNYYKGPVTGKDKCRQLNSKEVTIVRDKDGYYIPETCPLEEANK